MIHHGFRDGGSAFLAQTNPFDVSLALTGMKPLLPLLFVVGLVGCQGAGEPGKATTSNASASNGTAKASAVEKISGTRAKELVKAGALLVDVRTASEFEDRHIDGARNVPLDTVGAADLGPKDATVVLYCHSGRRSATAAEELQKRGYTHVKDLGGIDQWDR